MSYEKSQLLITDLTPSTSVKNHQGISICIFDGETEIHGVRYAYVRFLQSAYPMRIYYISFRHLSPLKQGKKYDSLCVEKVQNDS